MAVRVQSSFSGGELDPALQERTTFEKYHSGLKTARNSIIAKTGRIISPPGRKHIAKAKLTDRECIIYSPPNSGYLIEWGHLYVRVYDFDGTLIGEDTHVLTEDDLPNVRFEPALGVYCYVFCNGKAVNFLKFTTCQILSTANLFANPPGPTVDSSTLTGAGYDVEYVFTTVLATGQESVLKDLTAYGHGATKMPITAGTSNIFSCKVATASVSNPIKMNVYRRPDRGGAFGYIGSSTYKHTSGAFTFFDFTDLGQEADYTHSPPTLIQGDTSGDDPALWLSNIGIIYQQRLLLTTRIVLTGNSSTTPDKEAIYASRPGILNCFSREYPLNSSSALQFKAGSSGYAEVLHMIDNDGLAIFTTIGVFLHAGELSPSNLSCPKKGPWVIDANVPPLSVPGGVLFVDSSTNTIRSLSWSTEAAAYTGSEISTYSDHLFLGKQIKSWAFHSGDTALLWVSFDDGTCASFTYEPEQKMNAWTRHDYDSLPVEMVAGTGIANKTFFLVEKDGERYIELTVPRYVSGATLASDPEAYMGHSIALMTSMLSYRTLLNDSLVGADEFELTPVISEDWDGELTLTCGTSGIFTVLTYGEIGTVLRWFDSDGSSIDLEVTARASDNSVTVQPTSEFPEASATGLRLYKTATQVTGLQHLEGEYPSVMVDGGVVCSPNNDIENYPAAQVVGGVLEFPNGITGSIIHVGRPMTCDVETLDIDTVEQRPVLLESQIVNKVYVKVHRTRGLYVGSKFPANDKVNGMADLESYDIDENETGEDLIANTYNQPRSVRHEVTIDGDWKSNGRICLRQVDPVHFEILSIIPDTEDQRR